MSRCAHAPPQDAAATGAACADCGVAEQLRVCGHCGRVGCADSREGHATRHAQDAAHPVLREWTPSGETTWVWCDACGDYLQT